MRIIDGRYERFSRFAADARNSHQPLHLCVSCGQLLQPCFHGFPVPGLLVGAANQRFEIAFVAPIAPLGPQASMTTRSICRDLRTSVTYCRVVAAFRKEYSCVSVSKKQHIELNFPRSMARMNITFLSVVLGLNLWQARK